jgi:hypothetical protein
MKPFVSTVGGPATPVPLAEQLKGGTVGTAYSETISAQGGTSPYTYAKTSGTLPVGTSLNTSNGIISGTPSASATYAFTIEVTDVLGNTGTQDFQVVVASPVVTEQISIEPG